MYLSCRITDIIFPVTWVWDVDWGAIVPLQLFDVYQIRDEDEELSEMTDIEILLIYAGFGLSSC